MGGDKFNEIQQKNKRKLIFLMNWFENSCGSQQMVKHTNISYSFYPIYRFTAKHFTQKYTNKNNK